MKKIILWTSIIFLVLATLFVFVAYKSFNTEAFKNSIIKNIQQITGREFKVNGNYSLVWQPIPTMTLENVTLSNIEKATNEQMLTADKIQIHIEWSSLLSSQTKIKNIILTNPLLSIERISRSITNMDFPILFKSQNKLNMEDDFLLNQNIPDTKIENIKIENGTIQYINHMTKEKYQLHNINGDLAMGALDGPFKFEGKAVYQTLPLNINTSLSKIEVSLPTIFSTEITHEESGSNLKIQGETRLTESQPQTKTTIDIASQNPNDILGKLQWPTLAQNQTPLFGYINISPKEKNTETELVFKTGPEDKATTFDIKATTQGKSRQIKVEINELNWEEWQPIFTNIPLSSPIFQKQNDFTITVKKVILNGQQANTLYLVGTQLDKQITISEGSLFLAGNTTTQFHGILNTKGTSGAAEIDVQTQNINELLPVLKGSDKWQMLVSPFQKAEAKITTEWNEKATTIAIPALMLDETTGQFEIKKAHNKPTEITLELNNLNVNKYLNNTTDDSISWEEMETKIKNKLTTIQLPQYPLATNITVNNLTYKDQLFNVLTAVTISAQNNLETEFNLQTATEETLVANIKLQDIGSPNWMVKKALFEIATNNPEKLFKNLHILPPENFIKNATSLQMVGSITGQPENWNGLINIKTNKLALNAKGKLIKNRPQNMHFELKHNSSPHLIAAILEKTPFPQITDAFEIKTTLNTDNNQIVLSDLQLTMDSQELFGSAIYNLETKETTLNLKANHLDITNFLPDMSNFYNDGTGFDKTAFNFDFLKQLNTNFTLHANTLTYQSSSFENAIIQATVKNKEIMLNEFALFYPSGKASIQAKGTLQFQKSPTLNMSIVTQQVPLSNQFTMFKGKGLSEGFLSSEWHFQTVGDSLFQMSNVLNGSGKIALFETTLVGADLTNLQSLIQKALNQNQTQEVIEPQLKQSLMTGRTIIDQITGTFTITNGKWQMNDAVLKTPESTTTNMNIQWTMPTGNLSAKGAFIMNNFPSLPAIEFEFTKTPQESNLRTQSDAFAESIYAELKYHQQKALEEERRKKQEQLEQERLNAQNIAQQQTNKLSEQIQQLIQNINETPNVQAQKNLMQIQMMEQNIQVLWQDATTTIQYQYITEQTQQGLDEINKTNQIIVKQRINNIKKNSEQIQNQANDYILKLNEIHQKRLTVPLLNDLLQNAINQQEIIQRAIQQFEKPLTLDQVNKVFEIIQTALNKIQKATNMAEEIYTGRQTTTSNNIIQKVM